MWTPHALKMTLFNKVAAGTHSCILLTLWQMEPGDWVGPLTADRYPTGSYLTGCEPTLLSKSCVLFLRSQIASFQTPQPGLTNIAKDEVLLTGHFTIFKLRVDRQPLPSLHSPYNSAMKSWSTHTRTTLNHITGILYSNRAYFFSM